MDTLVAMLTHLSTIKSKVLPPQQSWPTVSVELEKPHAGLLALVPLADVLFFSKDFARHHGFHSAKECLQGMRYFLREELSICF